MRIVGIWSHVARQADASVAVTERDDGPIARSEVYEDFHRVDTQELDALLTARRGHAGRPAAERHT